MKPKNQNSIENKPKGVPDPIELPDDDTFFENVEWTPEEEEAFLKILNEDDDEGVS